MSYLSRLLLRINNFYYGLICRLVVFVMDYYRHVFGHYLIAYVYVCLYVQIAIKLLGFSVEQFAHQARDISTTWYYFKYHLLLRFYPEAVDFFYRIEFFEVSDALLFMASMVLNDNFWLTRLFPYFISFVTFF